ncbi:ribose ABC superfamily ATP binding cassette transporter, ABC domain protein [Brucella grignonensis]|uniref:Ribose ABC superfamily ATP binding cassette transporter, ABC domain protein n=1 Tax=Brucella grignonensis TaxID=94627 RepID=A0A256FCK5_9HYPH|nr:ribose ABC superfamily ATP binding cassette transporter, ABC domain protein [Brucella grignonensis]
MQAQEHVRNFDIRTPDFQTPVGTLSGGNIQKVLLAHELTGSAEAVIFAKPTYGPDVKNIRATRQRISDAADAGKAVLLISTDLDELLELADRVAHQCLGRAWAADIVWRDGSFRLAEGLVRPKEGQYVLGKVSYGHNFIVHLAGDG